MFINIFSQDYGGPGRITTNHASSWVLSYEEHFGGLRRQYRAADLGMQVAVDGLLDISDVLSTGIELHV